MNVHEPAPTIPSDALTGSVDTAQGVLTVDITFQIIPNSYRHHT